MNTPIDLLAVPASSGQVQIQVTLSAVVNTSAVTARRKVNAFLATHVGNLLLAAEPALTMTERIVWRVPVDVTDPINGRLGHVGEVDVDVTSGELLLTPSQITQLEENALRLTTRSPLPTSG